jgi:hypothetical protein
LGVKKVSTLEKAKLNGTAMYAAHNRVALAGMTKAATYALLRDQSVTLPDWDVGRDFGTATHTVLENVIKGQPLDTDLQVVEGTATYPVDNTFTEWVPKWWDEFVKDFDVEVVECEETVTSPLGYGGSFDLILRVNGVLTMVDAKSNRGGPRDSVALQNEAYRRCPEIIDMTTGVRRPMPEVERSAVLWLRPEGWNLYPLKDGDPVWRRFYAHLLLFQDQDVSMMGEGLNDGPNTIQYRRW